METHQLINDVCTLSDVKACINEAWNLRGPIQAALPVATPVTLNYKHLKILRNEPYFVAEKTDGVRGLLLLFRDAKDSPRAYFCSRKYQVYSAKIAAKPYFFKGYGTVLDGEYVRDKKGNATFLVFDLITHRNKRYLNESYGIRYAKMHEIIDNELIHYRPRDIQSYSRRVRSVASTGKIVSSDVDLRIRAKRMYPLAFTSSVWNKLKHSEFPTDGLIFTPERDGIHLGRHNRLFKWKEHYTIDLQKEGNTLYFLNNDGEIENIFDQSICIGGKSYKFVLSSPSLTILDDDDEKEQCIVEYKLKLGWDDEQIILNPVRRRTDKSHPNAIRSIRGILQSVAHPVDATYFCTTKAQRNEVLSNLN